MKLFPSPRRSRSGAVLVVAALLAAGLPLLLPAAAAAAVPAAAAGPCDPPVNRIACENSQPGIPRDDWYIESGYGDIEGYGTSPSVPVGQRIDFKVKTPASDYTIDIVRLGWYGGSGGRRITTLDPSVPLPQSQPACLNDAASGLVDCGTWRVSASWNVPATAVPGFYVANFVREDGTSGASQFPFVVRDDGSNAAIVVQTSDQTWQAYNTYGDVPGVNEYSTYEGGFPGSPDGRAYEVSYNRPYRNSGTSNYMNAEYPLLRWLERNGYDVTYVSGVDVHRNPGLLLRHDVYISSGHDEYVSGPQRAGIEAARAAGVHLAFLSGNEMFWKTRFEPGIDPAGTPLRTMAVYKETKAPFNHDPTNEWTGTWRDPRFSPPADGGRPENALTGTLFEVNGFRNDRIEVPAPFGRLRFWRGTPIATATTTTSLPQGTLGYEWDTDPDNGHRPPGAVRLSDTTIDMPTGDFVLQDFGATYGGGTKTHNMVLYRDPASRALVFGSGTVQWSWGLDPEHLYPNGVPYAEASTTVQQATVNLLADMGVQPTTLQTGVTRATGTTDTTGPVVALTSPAAGSTVPAGAAVTVQGTATDAGGVIGSVEVSVDAGVTWRRATATGATTWTYPWNPGAQGPAEIRVRASDDSANLGAEVRAALTVGPQQCPCTVFGDRVPGTVDSGDTGNLELGTKVVPAVSGTITGVRFHKSAANTGTHTGSLWTTAGQRLATGTFAGETATGWQTLLFDTPVQVRAGTTYVASYTTTTGHYSFDAGFFTGKGAGTAPLTSPSTEASGGNGLYRYGGGFPDSPGNGSNYWVDAILSTAGADTTAPTVTSRTPATGATGVATDADVTVVFSEPVDPASVTLGVAANGAPVPGTTAVDGATAVFTPTGLMTANTAHTVTVAATDGFGNALTGTATSTFTTGSTTRGCPCTLFRSTAPTRADAGDGADVELGVRFRASVNGQVTGVRFYKSAANTGVHTGTLWSPTGQVLATGTFADETAAGWQTLTFAQPVAVRAGLTYTASYRAPNGHYAADGQFFATGTAGRTPLVAPTSATVGGNGVFRYGGGHPTASFNDTNYWVDVTLATEGADNAAPTATGRTPAAGATGVATDAEITATFSEPIDPTSAAVTVTAGGATLPGSVTVDGATVRFTPDDLLAVSRSHSVSVTAADLSGNAVAAPVTWSFTTAAQAAGCPCTVFRNAVPGTVDSGDGNGVELGVRVRPTVNALITGVRFYKSAANTGTHTGSLWDAAGQRLATGTFTGETASGWQTLTFDQPVQVRAGQTYTASYRAPNGHYSVDRGYFTGRSAGSAPIVAPAAGDVGGQGVYTYGTGAPVSSANDANYWVDVVVATDGADTTAPTVASTTPASGATGASTTTSVTAVFSEPVDPATVQMSLAAGGTPVAGATAVAQDRLSATFDPTAALAASAAHTATVTAVDAWGNIMAPVSWSFTTATGSQCPCSLFRPTDVPANSATDNPVELGVRVVPTVAGEITGIRFYKIAGDTGTHTGSVWSATGQRLATGTFTGESASGWQTLQLAEPLDVAAGTPVVVSFTTTRFGYTRDVFATDRVAGPLTAPATTATAPNGVFAYGSAAVPDGNGNGTSYGVDLVFVPNQP